MSQTYELNEGFDDIKRLMKVIDFPAEQCQLFLNGKRGRGMWFFGFDPVEKRSDLLHLPRGERSYDDNAGPLIRFGKRDPGAPLIRFGRAPDAQPLIRFGKRTPDGAPLIRFGRNPDAQPLIRFGKRSPAAPLIR
ncbi:unnamed protein product [Cylicostephanus goldi]|uniref:Uncharacterized protein n=1 Tax=Cylicostephanus goldi TaxID=71465 RepID=A0A3P6RZ17_CYLGO|nr:unnamed protein product [Cylicostephanus goldi]